MSRHDRLYPADDHYFTGDLPCYIPELPFFERIVDFFFFFDVCIFWAFFKNIKQKVSPISHYQGMFVFYFQLPVLVFSFIHLLVFPSRKA